MTTVTEQLKEVVNFAVQKLPDKEQNMLARYIPCLLEAYKKEKEGDTIVTRPGFLKAGRRMHESLASSVEEGGCCL